MIRSSIKIDSTSTSIYQLPIAFQRVLASGYYLLCLYWNLGQFGILCKFSAASSPSVECFFVYHNLILCGFICQLMFAIFDQIESCSEILFLDLYVKGKSYFFPRANLAFPLLHWIPCGADFFTWRIPTGRRKKNIRKSNHEFKTSLGYYLVTPACCKYRQKDYKELNQL